MKSEVLTVLESGTREPVLPAAHQGKRYICFGPFHVDVDCREVFKQGARLRLQDKAYEVLRTLLERPGEVVTREELRRRLWPSDTHVNFDANVNTTVNKLRQALEDSSDESRYVQTFPRRGYCFVAPVEYVDTPPAPVLRNRTASRRASGKLPVPEGAAPFWQWSHAAVLTAIAAIVILAGGMLLGAGVVALWFARAPALPWH